MTYKPYWKSEFQKFLTSVNGAGNIVCWSEVSDQIGTNGFMVWEYVYKIELKNPSVSILVFSSVDKTSDRSREVNSDAVRLVFAWSTKNGIKYSKICKKYRVESLFENLSQELIAASNECFDLGKFNWVDSIEQSY